MLTLIFLLTLVVLLGIVLCRTFKSDPKKEAFFKTIPGPPPVFLFGNILEIGSPARGLKLVETYIKKYGKTFKLHIALYKVLGTCDNKFIDFLLHSSQTLWKSENYYYLQDWLGSGLLISHGQTWKRHRKIIAPSFHADVLKEFVGAFESHGDLLMEKLQEYVGHQSFDVYPLIKLCALDIICETAMGVNISAQDNDTSEYVQSMEGMCEIVVNRAMNPLKILGSTFKFTKDYRVQKKFLKTLHDFSEQIIKKRSQELRTSKMNDKSSENEEEERNNRKSKKKLALLDLLLEYSDNGQLMSYEEIRNQVDTFIFAAIGKDSSALLGHDTTTSAIAFTLYCLAEHPEVAEKAIAEQKSLFGSDKNPLITYSDLQNMKYLDMVIKESMRLYPPVPIIGRYTNEDAPYEDTVIPQGINIGIQIYATHRNDEFFPDPLKFDPDRFLDLDKFQPYTYIPFSAGPRNCIGRHFAMLEMKSLISKILRHFDVVSAVPEHKLELDTHNVLISSNGVKIRIERRES